MTLAVGSAITFAQEAQAAPCGSTCAACANAITDPRAKVLVKTRNGVGQLTVKAVLALASYTGGPVTIRVDDTDSMPIVQQALGGLPALGSSGTK